MIQIEEIAENSEKIKGKIIQSRTLSYQLINLAKLMDDYRG